LTSIWNENQQEYWQGSRTCLKEEGMLDLQPFYSRPLVFKEDLISLLHQIWYHFCKFPCLNVKKAPFKRSSTFLYLKYCFRFCTTDRFNGPKLSCSVDFVLTAEYVAIPMINCQKISTIMLELDATCWNFVPIPKHELLIDKWILLIVWITDYCNQAYNPQENRPQLLNQNRPILLTSFSNRCYFKLVILTNSSNLLQFKKQNSCIHGAAYSIHF